MVKKIKFIHFAKCGGSSIEKFIDSTSGAVSLHHYCITKQDVNDKDKFIWVSNIRHPYSWYGSMLRYRFGTRKYDQDPIYSFQNEKNFDNLTTQDKMSVLKKFLNWYLMRNSYSDPDISSLENHLIKYWMGGDCNRYKLYRKNPKDNFVITEYIRLEHINEDIQRVFNVSFDDIHINASGTKTNYFDLYDDEMKHQVYEKNKYIFEKFNYNNFL